MKISNHGRWLAIGALVLTMPACTIRATTHQTTDTTQNMTVTTSGKSWFTGDGLVQEGQAAQAFAALNEENLQQDIAAGRGEYLDSFATLLGVPADRQPAFHRIMQANHATKATGDLTSAGAWLAGETTGSWVDTGVK